MTQYQPGESPNTTFSVLSLDGGVNTQGDFYAGFEASLDIQWTVGLALGVPVTYLTVGGEFETGLLDTMNYLQGVENPPTVMTTSYGGNESSWDPALAQ